MKLIILDTHDPYLNLATEEYLLESSSDDIMMLWQNEPTVVIGKNQNAYAEINTEYTTEKGIHIARRISGGGAVYHDLGNVNYTFISTKNENEINFKTFTIPIIDSLSNLGIQVILSGRNDLEIDGKKISGNAQHVRNNRVLHHGTLLFDSDLGELSNALKVDPDKIKTKAIKSTRSRVTNLVDLLDNKMSVKEFINYIADFIITKYKAEYINAPQNESINKLAERNKSHEWLYPESNFISQYTIKRKVKYDFGIVDIYLNMKNDTIIDIKIFGDFFGKRDISTLENTIKNHTRSSILNLEEIINISDFIYGMKSEQFLEQIK